LLWRKFKLDWSYAIGELTIVTVGVLIALAVDQWNTDRLARADETAYISRVMGDLTKDIESLSVRLQALDQKASSLRRVADQLDSGLIADEPQFLQDAVIGANYGWNQGRANRATYDDLLGSGKFGIIGDQEVRLLIADYYQQFEEGDRRIEERETEYPGATYKLIPRATTVRKDSVVWERDVQPDLSPVQIDKIIQSIISSDLASLTIAETNFGKFVKGITVSQLEQARSLHSTLENYKDSID
jgi:hypothetical protein